MCLCVCLDINFDEINARQKTLINLDKMQLIVLKILDVHWQQATVTRYVKRHKRNSSNKFEIRDGIVFKTVVIPPAAPESSAPLILKPDTGQEPRPALSTCHCHVCNFTVNISNLLTDHISCIRQILEKKWEYNEAVHQFFIDFKKAYDSVRREVLYNILIEFGIPKKLVRLIKM